MFGYPKRGDATVQWFVFNLICVIGFFSAVSTAAGQALKVTVSYTGVGPTQLPVWVAKETGIFNRNGLDVQLIRAQAATSVMALLSGELNMIQGAAPAVVQSNLRGFGTVYVAAGYVGFEYWLMSQRDIKSAEQLKGGLLGVSGLTGASATATQLVLRKLGLVPGKDTSVIVIGGTPERLIALRTGKIQATLLNPPTTFVAQREGFNVLADLGTLPFQNNGVVTTRKFINEKPEVVRRYVKSQIEAVHLMKSERATGLKVLAKYMGGTSDQELLEKSYDASVTEHTFPSKQYPATAATWPGPWSPSTTAIAPSRRTTCGRGWLLSTPVCSRSAYTGTRATPCESTPRRLVQTSVSATVAAGSASSPAPSSSARVQRSRSPAATRRRSTPSTG
jgi:NitT/TauT family transport system substrate-binding protein